MLTPAVKNVHFIGVGGIGMSALAQWLLHQGYAVQGSDQRLNHNVQRLVDCGLRFFKGHDASHLEGVDLVVYSSAITTENPEWSAARLQEIPCVKRGALLAEVVAQFESIVVAGTHGKTTTTALLTHLLSDLGVDPSAFVGGVLPDQKGPLRVGSGAHFVVESDESDGSFLLLDPTMALVTNIDRDHLNNYGHDFEQLKQAFLQFINSVSKDGFAVVNGDDPVLQQLLPFCRGRVKTYGFSVGVDYRITDYQQNGMESSFFLTSSQGGAQSCCLPLPGRHNVSNAAGALALVDLAFSQKQDAAKALSHFKGVGRRFNCHGEVCLGPHSITCVEDYGHHPKAIAVTIEAARQAWPERRVLLVFQPHRYSRTQDLLTDFVLSLAQADAVVLLEVYAASETQDQGVGAVELQHQLELRGQMVYFVKEPEELQQRLRRVSQQGDVVLFQGAGNVGQFARGLFADVKRI